MTEILAAWLLAIGGGGVVAAMYFASLWWTVRQAARTRHPTLLVAGSYLMRAPIASLALIAVASGGDMVALGSLGGGGRLLAALAGFLVVRVVVVRSLRVGALLPSTGGMHAEGR